MAQARAALKQHKDVMEAAERIFDGAFDDVTDDGDVNMAEAGSSKAVSSGLAVRYPLKGVFTRLYRAVSH